MMNQRQKTDRSLYSFGAVTGWLVFALILLFAVLAIALIALGAQAYRSVAATAEENAHRRASVGYALSRVQTLDAEGAAQVRSVVIDGQETDVLVLCEEIDGEAYETRLYCAGGMLREQFVSAELPLETAEDGETIAELAGLEAEKDGALLTLRFTHPDGEVQTMHAALCSEGEGTP